MYIPEFPYKGNQVVLSSERVQILAKTDSVVLFGDQCVLLSSPKTVNIEASEGALIDSPKIELGHDAEVQGQPIILGYDFIKHLNRFLTRIGSVASSLQSVGETNPGDMVSKLVQAGIDLDFAASSFQNQIKIDSNLESKVLSKVTYTR